MYFSTKTEYRRVFKSFTCLFVQAHPYDVEDKEKKSK